MTVVLATQENIRKASQVLSSGGVVAFPTETVYGLGCDATNKEAVSRVYTLKNRPNDNPLIAHVSTTEEAKKITIGWDDRCDQLAERFWPGPLTIILKRGENVPKEEPKSGPDMIRDILNFVAVKKEEEKEGATTCIDPETAEKLACMLEELAKKAAECKSE